MIVDVYILNLNDFDCGKALSLLPSEIQVHSLALKLDKKRIEYIASQWLRYKILSKRLHIATDGLQFAVSKMGRPYLVNSDIDFNISHTCNYVVMAVSNGQRVGIDVQTRKEKMDVLAISKQYFAESEYRLIELYKEEQQRLDVFFWLWIYKEACLKLTGEGITNGLKRYIFEVDQEGLCISSNVNKVKHLPKKLDEKTFMCIAFENGDSEVCYHFL